MMSSRSRQKYLPQDLTDDEDSDIENFTDDSRSRMRKQESRPRQRRNTEQLDLDHREAEVVSRIQKMKEKSKFIRERRSGSLTNWPPTKHRDSGSLTPSDDELRKISSKYRKSSLTSPIPQNRKLLSDSASEKEAPSKQKTAMKVHKHVTSDSASEKEVQKGKAAAIQNNSKVDTATESEIEEEPVVNGSPVRSEVRPLKVTGNNQKLSNGVKKEETQKLQVIERPAQPLSPITRLAEMVKEVPKPKETQKVAPKTALKEAQTSTIKSGPPSTSKNAPSTSKETKATSSTATETSPIKEEQTSASKASTKAAAVPFEPVMESWECPHCTFVNEATAKVCTICCKTRVDILQQLPKTVDEDIDINEINDSILQNDSDAKQKGKIRKISFLPGTKAH